MTLQAVAPVRVTIPVQDDWIAPEQPYVCQIPLCVNRGTQWHHIVRRSATGGSKDWIAIDGVVVWNKARVCEQCHEKINGHGLWVWWAEKHDGGGAWAVYARGPRDVAAIDMEEFWLQNTKSGDWFERVGFLKQI